MSRTADKTTMNVTIHVELASGINPNRNPTHKSQLKKAKLVCLCVGLLASWFIWLVGLFVVLFVG